MFLSLVRLFIFVPISCRLTIGCNSLMGVFKFNEVGLTFQRLEEKSDVSE